jgi:hypothetical protein
VARITIVNRRISRSGAPFKRPGFGRLSGVFAACLRFPVFGLTCVSAGVHITIPCDPRPFAYPVDRVQPIAVSRGSSVSAPRVQPPGQLKASQNAQRTGTNWPMYSMYFNTMYPMYCMTFMCQNQPAIMAKYNILQLDTYNSLRVNCLRGILA